MRSPFQTRVNDVESAPILSSPTGFGCSLPPVCLHTMWEGQTCHDVANPYKMRRARYLGSKKLRLQAFVTATAINVLRAVQWLKGARPASTPVSRFARLMAAATLAVAA